MQLQTNLGKLRLLAWLEGTSFLVLLAIGMPLKYMYEMHTPNYVIGMIHAILFIAYYIYVMVVKSEHQWNFSKTSLALVASLLPFGTFVADAKIFNAEALRRRD